MKNEIKKKGKQKDPPIRTIRETRKKEIRAANLLIIETLRELVQDGVDLEALNDESQWSGTDSSPSE